MYTITNTVERQKASDWIDILNEQIESNFAAYCYDILDKKERELIDKILSSKINMIESALVKYDKSIYKKLTIKNI